MLITDLGLLAEVLFSFFLLNVTLRGGGERGDCLPAFASRREKV